MAHRITVHLRRRAGKWLADWYDYPSGQRRHRTETLGGPDEIKRRDALNMCREIERRESARTSHIWTVAAFAEEVWLPARSGDWRPRTEQQMRSALNTHIIPAFGKMRVESIKKMHVDGWLRTLPAAGYSRATGTQLLTVLRSILSEAEANRLIEFNPAKLCRLPKGLEREVETEAFTESEARELCGVSGIEGVMVRCLILLGLRPGELQALRAEDVIDRGHRLVIDESINRSGEYGPTKTDRVRPCSVPPRLAADLAALAAGMPPEAPLFRHPRSGSYWHYSTLERAMSDASPVKGFSLRRCRATFSTLFEGDVRDVQEQLGHATAAMTLRHYRKPLPERLAEGVAELEKRMVQ